MAQPIPVMGDIYKKAVAVDTWLGPENDVTARAIAFLRKLSHLPNVKKWKIQRKMAGRIVSPMRKIIDRDTSKALDALLDFLPQPWISTLR